MSHKWSLVDVKDVTRIMKDVTGKDAAIYRCDRCRQVAYVDPGEDPSSDHWTEDCDVVIVKRVTES